MIITNSPSRFEVHFRGPCLAITPYLFFNYLKLSHPINLRPLLMLDIFSWHPQNWIETECGHIYSIYIQYIHIYLKYLNYGKNVLDITSTRLT